MKAYLTSDELLEYLKARLNAEGGIAAWARNHNVSREYVHDVLKGRRPIGSSIADALGFETRRVFVRKAEQ